MLLGRPKTHENQTLNYENLKNARIKVGRWKISHCRASPRTEELPDFLIRCSPVGHRQPEVNILLTAEEVVKTVVAASTEQLGERSLQGERSSSRQTSTDDLLKTDQVVLT